MIGSRGAMGVQTRMLSQYWLNYQGEGGVNVPRQVICKVCVIYVIRTAGCDAGRGAMRDRP